MLGLKLKVSEREVGELGISIPTSVAIEALLAESEVRENEIWINIRTLFRNLHGSVDGDFRPHLTADVVVPTLISEMIFISKNVRGLTARYYCPDYKDIHIRLPSAIPRPVNTEKQAAYLALESEVTKQLMDQAVNSGVDIHPVSTKIKERVAHTRALIITHSPIDLLFTDFKSLRLLESHTGRFKTKSEWNSKLTNGNLLGNLPFNKFTIQIFGDNNGLLKAMPIAIRTAVLDMATADHWTPMTTDARIDASISKLKDHLARAILKKVMRS